MIPRRFFWLFDILALSLAFGAAYWLVPHIHSFLDSRGMLQIPLIAALSPYTVWTGQLPAITQALWIFLVVAPVAILALEILGNYGNVVQQSRTRIVLGGLVSALAGVSFVALVLYAVRDPNWSRLFIFSFALLSGLALGAYRMAIRAYYLRRQRAGYYTKNVVVAGSPAGLQRLVSHLSGYHRSVEHRLIGYLRLTADQPLAEFTGLDLPCLGDVDQLGSLLIRRPIHEVILLMSNGGVDCTRAVIEHCDYFRIGLRIVPEALLEVESKDLEMLFHADPLRLPAVVLRPRHLDSEALFAKRLIDIAVSAALLVLLAPVFLLIAVAIKLTTPHLPVMYPWRVVGHKGALFTGYKFTTMVADADARKAELLSRNEMTGPVFKIKDDPRVTPLGRFLRKYSLNELPQLWSVLKGDMSLMGPRPAGPHELEHYQFWHKRKLSIRPGITCLWQVRGRNRISSFDDWVRMDLEYIDHWSLWLDFKILVWTAWAVLAGTGS